MICNSANSYNKLQFKVHTCTSMQSLGGIEYLIVGGKGTNLSFEDLEFKNQKLITYSIKIFKLQPKALFTLRSSSIPKCQHFKLLVKFKLSPIFIHPCSFFCHLKKMHCATKFFFVSCVTFFGGFLFYQIVNVSWHPKSPHLLISSSRDFLTINPFPRAYTYLVTS